MPKEGKGILLSGERIYEVKFPLTLKKGNDNTSLDTNIAEVGGGILLKRVDGRLFDLCKRRILPPYLLEHDYILCYTTDIVGSFIVQANSGADSLNNEPYVRCLFRNLQWSILLQSITKTDDIHCYTWILMICKAMYLQKNHNECSRHILL